ncbi:MAG TPA: DUF3604 domain-containing protein [Candidatus Latescibacteria bacterium]|nr:DUF3604 domain-containing protein [Candidatus Latescibacterota bacterium]
MDEHEGGTIIPAIQLGVRRAWRGIEFGTREWWREYRRFIHELPVPGEAWLEPERVQAGEEVYLKLSFRVGARGIDRYGHIAVETPFRTLQPLAPDTVLRSRTPYLSVSCTDPRSHLDVTCSDGIVDILVQAYPLEEGEIVTVHFADPLGNPIRMPEQSLRYPFPVALDVDNSGRYRRIASFPVLEVTGGYPRCLYVVAPSAVQPGEPFRVRALALDGFDGNPSPGYSGHVRVLCTDPLAQVPCEAEISDNYLALSGVVLRTPGVHTITLLDEHNGLIGQSPPIGVDFFPEGWRAYFGDIHGHNEHCDGRGTVDEYYLWARDVRILDFCALTNHVEGAKRLPVEDFWRLDIAKANDYNSPGNFVAFVGFEWGGWTVWGDKCVYYLEGDGPYFPANEPVADTPGKLFARLESRDAIVVPHHTKYGGRTVWDEHDPRWEPVVEIYSIWGSSECYGEHSVQAAWERGYRLGVIAGSDDHTGHPGTPPGGLACILAGELTREALFYALESRRCYGTTGARILLDFRVNGVPVGGVVRNTETVEVYVRVAGTAPIEKVEILRDSEVVYSADGDGREVTLRWREVRGRGRYYYVRVAQADGHLAWSSPIWIE